MTSAPPTIVVLGEERPVVLGTPGNTNKELEREKKEEDDSKRNHSHQHHSHSHGDKRHEGGMNGHLSVSSSSSCSLSDSDDDDDDDDDDKRMANRDCCLGGQCNECSRHCGQHCCGRNECCDQMPCCQQSGVCKGCNKFCCDDECGNSCSGRTCCCIGNRGCCAHDPCGDCCGADNCCRSCDELCLRDRCCRPQENWSRVLGCCPLSTFHLTIVGPLTLLGVIAATGMAIMFVINKVSADIPSNDSASILEKLKEGIKSIGEPSTLIPTVANLLLAFVFFVRTLLILPATCCRSRCAARGLDCGFRPTLVLGLLVVGINCGFFFSGELDRSTNVIIFLILEAAVVAAMLLGSRCAENAGASLRAVVVAGGNGFERRSARHIHRHGDRAALLLI